MINHYNAANKSRTKKGIFIILLCLTVLITSTPLAAETGKYPRVARGLLDLSSWNLARNGDITLNGEWEFYWNEYMSPSALETSTVSPAYITVPYAWHNQAINGMSLPRHGYASYRLTIILPPADNSMKALKLPAIYDAYRLWANGNLTAVSGNPGTSLEDTKPYGEPRIVLVQPQDGKLDLLLQVANFHHINGGIRQEIIFGTPEQMIRRQKLSLSLQLFLMGGMLLMGPYFIVHFLFRKEEKYALYFGLFCLAMAFRLFFADEAPVYLLFPDFSWHAAKRLEFIFFYSCLPLYICFINHLYPKYVLRNIANALLLLSA